MPMSSFLCSNADWTTNDWRRADWTRKHETKVQFPTIHTLWTHGRLAARPASTFVAHVVLIFPGVPGDVHAQDAVIAAFGAEG